MKEWLFERHMKIVKYLTKNKRKIKEELGHILEERSKNKRRTPAFLSQGKRMRRMTEEYQFQHANTSQMLCEALQGLFAPRPYLNTFEHKTALERLTENFRGMREKVNISTFMSLDS